MRSCEYRADSSMPGHKIVVILHAIWTAWKRVGQFIGDLIARLVLSLFYFTLFVPFALGVRLLGDPLDMKAKANPSWWRERTTRDLALGDARRQF